MSPTIITFPAVAKPSQLSWTLERRDGRFQSPLSGTFQDIVRQGSRWLCQMSWKTLTYSDSQLLQAWAVQMAKGNVRCALPNYAYKQQGSGSGSPVMSGSGQAGTNSLNTAGWTASASNLLLPGDMVEIAGTSGHQLLMVTAPVNSGAAPAARANSTVYALNATATDPNGTVVTATTGGTSAGSPPTFSRVYGGTTTDGTVVWTLEGGTAVAVEPALRLTYNDATALTLTSPSAYFAFAKPSSTFSYTPPRIAAFSVSLIEDIQQ